MIVIKSRYVLFLFGSLLGGIKAQNQATCGQNRCIQLFDPSNIFDWQNNFDPFSCGVQCSETCGRNIGECLLSGGGGGGCDAGQYCVNFATHTLAAQLSNYDYDGIDPCSCSLPELDCFSSMATVDVEHKGKTPVKDIQVGDKVLTGSNGYRTVYTIDHKDPVKETNFIQVFSSLNEDSPLEITKSHMVFIHGRESPVPASELKVGDSIQRADGIGSTVTKISTITRKGLWNPITTDGTIVVDGIVTSTYNKVFEDTESDSVQVAGGFNLLSHHEFLHLLMAPYRAMCLGVSLSFCESTKEFNIYSSLGNNILKFYLEQNKAIQDMMVLGSLVTFGLLNLIMHPLIVIGVIFGVYYSTSARKEKKKKMV